MVANFNQSIRQIGEHVPAFVFRGDYTPKGTDYWGFGFAGALGYKTNLRAQPDGSGDPNLDGKDSLYGTLEVDSWYNRGRLTFNTQLTYGHQDKAAITADATGSLRPAEWLGASALVAYKFTPVVQGVLRGDFIYDQKNGGGLLDWTAADPGNGLGPDQNGGDPDKGANKYAITAGLNYAYNSNVTFKLEYRFDGATQNVFGNKDAITGTGTNPEFTKSNSLVSTQVVFYF
jgi:opacity protein-like surface antigen